MALHIAALFDASVTTKRRLKVIFANDPVPRDIFYALLRSTAGKCFLTITSIMSSMISLTTVAIDILKATTMQISMWKWEMKMIAKFGFNWGYDKLEERF
jgi:hypothetical protein